MPPPSGDGSRNDVSLSPASHVIVCGLGPLGDAVVRALVGISTTIIGIPQEADVEEIPSEVITIEGNPTSETVLRRASIERATALISTVEGDEDYAIICLTAPVAQSQDSTCRARRISSVHGNPQKARG